MSETLIRVGISNTCFALLLAIPAILAGIRMTQPHLSHTLWILVLAKLLTPPLWSITVPHSATASVIQPVTEAARATLPDGPIPEFRISPAEGIPVVTWDWEIVLLWLVAGWFVGSLFIGALAMRRLVRFEQLIRTETLNAPEEVMEEANRIAQRLGVHSQFEVRTTNAQVAPLVWWVGGTIRVILPNSILQNLSPSDWRWILAHELAHVQRRDHLVRWLEGLTCLIFWWHPLTWWARSKLRDLEEVCCDALVLSALDVEPRTYAKSLLKAIESLARPVFRPPAVASQLESGGSLEQRFRMIVSNPFTRPKAPWLRTLALTLGLIVLPLGLASGQDYEALQKRLGEAVKAGEISEAQARFMINALRLAEELQSRHGESEGRISPEEFERTVDRIRAAVQRGDITEEEARDKISELRQRVADRRRERRDDDRMTERDAINRRITGALTDSGLEREKIREVVAVIQKIVAEIREEGNSFKLDEEIEEYLTEELELSQEQVRQVVEIAERLADARSEGKSASNVRISPEEFERTVDRIRAAVQRGDITEEEARDKISELRQRVADRRRERRDDDRMTERDAINRRITGALTDSGLEREKIREVVAVIQKIVAEIREEGNSFKLDEEIEEYLTEELELSQEQVRQVVEIAERLADAGTEGN